MIELTTPKNYFSEKTISHLRMHEELSDRFILRSLDVTLAAKLTHVYGKYHLMMDYRKLAMSNYQMNYQQAECQAAMMNQITIVQHSPEDFMETPEDRTNNSIDTYKEYKRLLQDYSDEQFVPNFVDQFCKAVYEDDDNFIFFKPFCNLYFSVYADALLWYQQGKINYEIFCWYFQELSWMDGSRKPLNGRDLRRYIMSMREVIDKYKLIVEHYQSP